MNSIGRQTTAGLGRWGVAAALVLALGACDSLLEVNLPSAVTAEQVENAATAPILANSVMAQFECGYAGLIIDASGMEDNFQMVSGVAGNYSQYTTTPGGGGCGADAYSQGWYDPMLIGRAQGYSVFTNLRDTWTTVPDREKLMAQTAFYTAAILDVFGEYFCETTIDAGPLLTPAQTLTVAEGWIDSAFAAVTAAGGDFAITTAAGTHSTSIMTAAYGLRSRIRWARGDLATAAGDAALVPNGHVTWVLREEGLRKNRVSTLQSGGASTQAAGFLQGPVRLRTTGVPYGVTLLGSHPNGTAWTSPIPFTGYLNLGIETLTGRAVSDTGVPVLDSTEATPNVKVVGTSDDTRVAHANLNTAGGLLPVPQKYPNTSDDIPLINWQEMRLIQAEAAGPGAAATALVNEIRTAAGLPLIQGAYLTLVESDAARFEDMIIEERRRALFEEGRFWSTKILNNEKLWFPRAVGRLSNQSSYSFGGGVRQLMSNDEYQINLNLATTGALALRGTGCTPFEAPII